MLNISNKKTGGNLQFSINKALVCSYVYWKTGISIVNCAVLNKKIGKLEYKAKYGKPHPHLPLRYSRFSDFGHP